MKFQNLSDNELKEICGGLTLTLVRPDKDISAPVQAESGIMNALFNVTGYTQEPGPGDHGIANISSGLDGYNDRVAGSKSGQFG